MIFPLVYIPAIFVQVREYFVDHGCGVEWRMRKTIIVSISFFRTKYGTQLCSETRYAPIYFYWPSTVHCAASRLTW